MFSARGTMETKLVFPVSIVKTTLGSVDYNDEDRVFYGKVQGIDGLVSFEGKPVDALRKDFEQAVDDYLKLCRKAGKPAQKSYKGSFNVRIPHELHRSADRKAAEMRLTLNQFVRKAIEDELLNGSAERKTKCLDN